MAIPNLNLFAFRTYSGPIGPEYTPFNSYADYQYDWWWNSYAATSNDDLAAYYANLLILQYQGKPKAFATIEASVLPFIMNQLPIQVQNAFNLIGPNPAIGKQLDILGKYVGVVRTGYGFSGQPITLDDTDFLTLINMAIIRNNAGSSLSDIQLFLNQYFAGEVFLFDYANMNMSYLIDTNVGNEGLIELFVTEGLLPKPMGVGLSVVAAPVIDMFFGCRTYEAPASSIVVGLNTYGSFNTSYLFLTYADAIGT